MSCSKHSLVFSAPFSLEAAVAHEPQVNPPDYFSAEQLAAEYKRGRLDGAREADQDVERRFVEFRTDVSSVLNGLFARLAEAESSVSQQIQAALPELALEVAKRLLHGHTPPAEAIEGICAHAMAAVFPEVHDLEVVVGERDHGIVERLLPAWRNSYPGVRVCVNPGFAPGECQVRSRFGVVDARHEAKLRVLGRELQCQ